MIIMYQFSRSKTMPPFSSRDLRPSQGVTMRSPWGHHAAPAQERHKSWVAVACSDGAVRLVDTSPQRAASVVRTSYAHGVEATAVAISREGTGAGDGGMGGGGDVVVFC